MKYINEQALMEALGDDSGLQGLRVLNDLLSEWQMACNKVFSRMGDISPSSLKDIIKRVDDFGVAQEALGILEKILARGDFPPAHKHQAIAPITDNTFANQFQAIEACDLRVAHIFLNAREYADLRKWGRDSYTIESRAALLKLGLMGTMWGATITTSRKVPAGTVWFTTEGRYLFPNPECSDSDILVGVNNKDSKPLLDVVVETQAGLFNPYGMLELSVVR